MNINDECNFDICKKIPYGTRREAVAAQNRNTGMELSGKPYRCKHCGFWHFGHAPPKKSKVGIWRKKHKRSIDKLFRLIDHICGVK